MIILIGIFYFCNKCFSFYADRLCCDLNMRFLVFSVMLSVNLLVVRQVSAHGRLIEPPSRASMWRYGFNTPHDYNDHECYCGGFTRQWQRNKGKCGICGDSWDSPTVSLIETSCVGKMSHEKMFTIVICVVTKLSSLNS